MRFAGSQKNSIVKTGQAAAVIDFIEFYYSFFVFVNQTFRLRNGGLRNYIKLLFQSFIAEMSCHFERKGRSENKIKENADIGQAEQDKDPHYSFRRAFAFNKNNGDSQNYIDSQKYVFCHVFNLRFF